MLVYDTETCGLHGPIVLIQYQFDDDEIVLHSLWHETIIDTLTLIERFCEEVVVGFNLAFDWFHICQAYTTLTELGRRVGFNEYPIDHINTYAECEPIARDGWCVKPKSALDLMLHARKGPYQSTMDRKDIRIRKVPAVIAEHLAAELERRIPLKDIYFARRKEKNKRKWEVFPIKRADDTYDPNFRDVVLKFAPSSALKALAVDALGLKDIATFTEIEPPGRPIELGYAPYALAVSSASQNWTAKVKNKKRVGAAWPGIIRSHISHWTYNDLARKYAYDDVVYTRGLYDFFGQPEPDDVDSVLACMVGAVRWRGFSVNLDDLKKLRTDALTKKQKAPTSPKKVFQYLEPHLTPEDKAVLQESTKKTVLEELAKRPGVVGEKAKECIEARLMTKEIELYDKILVAGRLHASFKIIGTLSSRMSGTDGLNPQGIKHAKYVRKCFPLAWPGLDLCGGDFASFEVSIADAEYNDENLRKDLLTCVGCGYVRTVSEYKELLCPQCKCGLGKCSKCKRPAIVIDNKCKDCGTTILEVEDALQKIHGLFGMALAPGTTYLDILLTKGKIPDLYDQGKRGVFSQMYGGDKNTIKTKIGISIEEAEKAEQLFLNRYKGVFISRQKISSQFCSMRQPDGIGTKVEWHDPADYIESLTGFRRYFTLENSICKAIYNLANKLPPNWRALEGRVVRRDREQKIGGAIQSALFSAAFQIQAKALRAAANHRIQSTGATITKELQRDIWTLQPFGVHSWVVQPMNIHDEIMCPSIPEIIPKVKEKAVEIVNKYQGLVPLIKIDWMNKLNSWADK